MSLINTLDNILTESLRESYDDFNNDDDIVYEGFSDLLFTDEISNDMLLDYFMESITSNKIFEFITKVFKYIINGIYKLLLGLYNMVTYLFRSFKNVTKNYKKISEQIEILEKESYTPKKEAEVVESINYRKAVGKYNYYLSVHVIRDTYLTLKLLNMVKTDMNTPPYHGEFKDTVEMVLIADDKTKFIDKAFQDIDNDQIVKSIDEVYKSFLDPQSDLSGFSIIKNKLLKLIDKYNKSNKSGKEAMQSNQSSEGLNVLLDALEFEDYDKVIQNIKGLSNYFSSNNDTMKSEILARHGNRIPSYDKSNSMIRYIAKDVDNLSVESGQFLKIDPSTAKLLFDRLKSSSILNSIYKDTKTFRSKNKESISTLEAFSKSSDITKFIAYTHSSGSTDEEKLADVLQTFNKYLKVYKEFNDMVKIANRFLLSSSRLQDFTSNTVSINKYMKTTN